MERADVVVVGLGAMGSASLYQLARRGVAVIGIDRFSPPHVLGSTHGDTRITRQAIGEGMAYVPLVLRSHQLWREIEAETGRDLFTACGGLILAAGSAHAARHGTDDFFAATVSAAAFYDIDHEILSTDEVRARFPQFHMTEEHRCYYEPGAGFVRPEAAVTAQLELALREGAQIRRDERVTQISSSGSGVLVQTDKQTYGADGAILTAGPWIGKLLGDTELASRCVARRQVLHWFDASQAFASLTPDRMPVFIWEYGSAHDGMFYGFPAIDGPQGGLKVATEQYEVATDPDDLTIGVTADESQAMFNSCVKGRLPIGPSVVRTARCLYTVTPDHQFIIDRHPQQPRVLIASPCSGHGFKHSAAMGESLAQLALDGTSTIDLSAFTLARFLQ